MSSPRRNPYVVGQWVRGERFYGRRRILAAILRDAVLPDAGVSRWVLGTRRIGKTSLLRQIEHLTEGSTGGRQLVPLYWDLQGSDNPDELRLGFMDALLDAEERLGARGVDIGALEDHDLISALQKLRAHLTSRGDRLLLLADEAEELLSTHAFAPDLVGRLAGLAAGGAGMTLILTSSIRLRELTGPWTPGHIEAEPSPRAETSRHPLRGFLPPLSLGPLTTPEALDLVRQSHLPVDHRPDLDSAAAGEICRRCGNHPYLLQLLSKRSLELGDLDRAEATIADDQMVARFLEVDFEMLDRDERALLRRLAATGGPHDRPSALVWLQALGLVSAVDEDSVEIPNPIFRRWLDRPESRDSEAGSRGAGTTGLPVVISADDASRLSRILSVRALSRAGDEPTPERLAELVYDELRDLAGRYMRRERREHTLQPTALVHEAYMKLADQSRVDWQGRTHFLALGAQAMRRILIDHARGRGRVKRGAEWYRVPLLEEILPSARRGLDAAALMDVDRAVVRLAADHPRQARVVELRFFAGLEVAEVAEILGVSKRTVEGDWAKARERLASELAEN